MTPESMREELLDIAVAMNGLRLSVPVAVDKMLADMVERILTLVEGLQDE
jgi:hypothetical protein